MKQNHPYKREYVGDCFLLNMIQNLSDKLEEDNQIIEESLNKKHPCALILEEAFS
jgi:hypothetical protein